MVNSKKEGKEADEGREVVSLTHYRLIKLEYSPLPARVWSCSAALSQTALFLQSIAPSFHQKQLPRLLWNGDNSPRRRLRQSATAAAPRSPRGSDDEPNILFIFPSDRRMRPPPPSRLPTRRPSSPRVWGWRESGEMQASACSGRYLDRTRRRGGNEAFYTSWLWNKKWCFDCIVRALSGV